MNLKLGHTQFTAYLKKDDLEGGVGSGRVARLGAIMGFGSSGELCKEVLLFLGDVDLRRVRRPTERFGFLVMRVCVFDG